MKNNDTRTESWSVENLVNAITDSSNKNKILIPKFQRNLVWSAKQKKEFIDSIKKGFPVGALLLFKTNTDKEITYYTLIDGLQRSTTLKQYSKAPTSAVFFDENNINIDFLQALSDRVDVESIELLSDIIVEWVVGLRGFEESDGFSAYSLAMHLNKQLSLGWNVDDIDEVIKFMLPFVESIKNESDISSFNIPVLVYSGLEDNLPIIFERLNSKGSQLNKYQIYAATWNDEHFEITNMRIIEKIKAKYEALIIEGYEVDNFESENFNTSKFSCFEYIFGFGKLLCEDYPLLFSGNSKEEKEDSIGFNVINICLGKPFNEMKSLPKYFLKYDTEDLENSILYAIDFVNTALKTQLELKANTKSKSSTPTIVHSEMQIVSIIGKVFQSKFNESLETRDNWIEKSKALEENIKFHYLFDILKESWKGSGDTRAYSLIRSSHYENKIRKDQWDHIFEEWLDGDLKKREKKRIAIKPQSILFLKYIYVRILPVEHQTSKTEFDIEHLVPVEKLKMIAGDEGLPISAFPNLCLLDRITNRAKKSMNFYQYIDELRESSELTIEQAKKEIEKFEKYSFTKVEDLDFMLSKDSFNSANYERFLKKRFNRILEIFFELYEIN